MRILLHKYAVGSAHDKRERRTKATPGTPARGHKT